MKLIVESTNWAGGTTTTECDEEQALKLIERLLIVRGNRMLPGASFTVTREA